MEAEAKRMEENLELSEIIDKTRELTAFFHETKCYRMYLQNLDRLRKRPELYRRLNVFRRENLRLQMMSEAEDYDEKTDELQKEYKNILMEAVVMDFLQSEQMVCKMFREVYNVLAEEIELDISYMEEE